MTEVFCPSNIKHQLVSQKKKSHSHSILNGLNKTKSNINQIQKIEKKNFYSNK